MKKRTLVDITAATEYAKKIIEESARKNADEHLVQHNNCHKRKIKNSSIEDMKINFDGLTFGFVYYINGYKDGESGCFNIPIDKFIVNQSLDKI